MEMSFFCGLFVFLFAVVAVRPDDATPSRCTDPLEWKCKFLYPLEEAIRTDDQEGVRRLATAVDEKGRTALHAASYFDLAETAQLLLNNGANVNAADEDGSTPLHVAAGPGPGSVKVVKVLVDNGADINARTGSRAKASTTSCEPSYDWKCKFLDPLREAIGNDDQEALRRLATTVDKSGRTALHAASYFDLPDFVERLLKSGANVNAADEDGYTPLHVAAGHSMVPVVKILLDNGADINARTGKRKKVPPSDCESDDWLCKLISPLVTAAVEGGDPAAMQLLMEAVDDEGRTALHAATQYDMPSVVEWLLEHGFPVDTVDKKGRPASYVAVEYNRPNIMEILLDGGADSNFRPGKQKWEKQQKKKALQKCA